MTFDQTYYTSGNYVGYLDRRERYIHLAADIAGILDGLGVGRQARLLDFGCACGFLASGLASQGYQVCGHDVSEWAIEYGRLLGIAGLTTDPRVCGPGRLHEVVTALDTLEHLRLAEIEQFLAGVKTSWLVVRIPIAAEPGGPFVLEKSRNDPTHVTCLTRKEWLALLARHGYAVVAELDTPTIYDSPGVLAVALEFHVGLLAVAR